MRCSSGHSRATTRTEPRRAFALLTTLLLAALLIAVVGQLATTTSMATAGAKRRLAGLQHELAVDSLLAVLPLRLAAGSPIQAQLDVAGRASLAIVLDDVAVSCVIADDGARFNPNSLPRGDQQVILARTLRAMGDRYGLPGRVEIQPLPRGPDREMKRPIRTFDQVVVDAEPASFLPWGAEQARAAVWADVVTLWGDGRIALRRADAELLDIALADIRPGLGRVLLADRPKRRDENFVGASLARVDAEVRGRVAERITFDAGRYALAITTSIGQDRRHWYVVATLGKNDLVTLHRSQVTW